jgi:hypothetical protein
MNLTIAGKPASAAAVSPARQWPQPHWLAVPPAQSSCCCPAQPIFQAVILPGGTTTDPVELLLCAHHYRQSREALARLGSAIYDRAGVLVVLLG